MSRLGRGLRIGNIKGRAEVGKLLPGELFPGEGFVNLPLKLTLLPRALPRLVGTTIQAQDARAASMASLVVHYLVMASGLDAVTVDSPASLHAVIASCSQEEPAESAFLHT